MLIFMTNGGDMCKGDEWRHNYWVRAGYFVGGVTTGETQEDVSEHVSVGGAGVRSGLTHQGR